MKREMNGAIDDSNPAKDRSKDLEMMTAKARGGGSGRSSNSLRPLMRSASEAMAESILSDVDPWTAWLYKPHTAFVTIAGAGLLLYAPPSSLRFSLRFRFYRTIV